VILVINCDRMEKDDKIEKLIEWTERPELIYKLKTGWHLISNRYGYYDNQLWKLLALPIFLIPIFFFVIIPWYVLDVLLQVEFIFIVTILSIPGIILGFIFVLLFESYAWHHSWYDE